MLQKVTIEMFLGKGKVSRIFIETCLLIAYPEQGTYHAHVIQAMRIICPQFNIMLNPRKEV